jgi:glycosyltransferase involved in cell wall biosynthesis
MGVSDLLEVIAIARSHGEEFRASLAGFGRVLKALKRRARRLGIGAAVDFVGHTSCAQVLELMHAGDVVVVSSRHDYPDGIPQTIYRVGLAIACGGLESSDVRRPYPAGLQRCGLVVFRAAASRSFYQAIHDFVHDAALYERLSLESDEFATKIHGPLKWHQVVMRWISGSAEDDVWSRQFAVVHDARTGSVRPFALISSSVYPQACRMVA